MWGWMQLKAKQKSIKSRLTILPPLGFFKVLLSPLPHPLCVVWVNDVLKSRHLLAKILIIQTVIKWKVPGWCSQIVHLLQTQFEEFLSVLSVYLWPCFSHFFGNVWGRGSTVKHGNPACLWIVHSCPMCTMTFWHLWWLWSSEKR